MRPKSRNRPKSRRRQKNTQLLGTEKNKSCNLSGQKKSLNLSVPKKSRNLSGQKKNTQPIGTTKNQATSWGKKCPKNSNLSHNQTSGDRHRSPWSCSVSHPFPPVLHNIINHKREELGSLNFERMFTPPNMSMSCVMCHVSYVMCHMTCVTCHVSHVTCHM